MSNTDNPIEEIVQTTLLTKQEAIRLLDGAPSRVYHFTSGTTLVEVCDHDECHIVHLDQLQELKAETCCLEDNCDHYNVVLCEQHEATPKKKVFAGKCGTCRKNGFDTDQHPSTPEAIKLCYAKRYSAEFPVGYFRAED